MNVLCNGYLKNNNPKSPIAYFEIITVREFSDYEGGSIVEHIKNMEHFLDTEIDALDEPFYQIYGKRYTDDVLGEPIFLGDFSTIEGANKFLYNLTGEYPDIISY